MGEPEGPCRLCKFWVLILRAVGSHQCFKQDVLIDLCLDVAYPGRCEVKRIERKPGQR